MSAQTKITDDSAETIVGTACRYAVWGMSFLSAFAIYLISAGSLHAGPAEDLAQRRAKLESMEYGFSAWSYDSWTNSVFRDPINFYNNIDSADTIANLRCNYVYDMTVNINSNKTLTFDRVNLGEPQRTRSLYPDNLIITMVDAKSFDGGFSASTGTFSNWTVAQYEAAADLIADQVIADPYSDGLQVDIEPMSRSWMPFMRRLSTRLHAAGKLSTLYVLPGWTASGDQPLTDANFTELFTICDSVNIDLYSQATQGNNTQAQWQTWATNHMNRLMPLADAVNGNLVIGISSKTWVSLMLNFASNYSGNASFAGLAIYDLTFTKLSNQDSTTIHNWVRNLGRQIEVSTPSVSVPEGGTETFQVRLLKNPSSNVTVNVSRQSGDSNIGVSGGATLTFTPSNATDWQTVTLSAAEDADKTNGTATIQCVDSGGGYASATLEATEADNDNSTPVVDAGADKTVILQEGVFWTPAETTTVAWYDANDASTIIQSGGKVSQWNDKSGNGNHATQTVGARQPSYTAADAMVNNMPTIGSPSTSGQIGLETPQISAKQVYVVTYYKDGLDASFDGFATLFSGPGLNGERRVIGNSGSANLITTKQFNSAGTYKNGSTTSSITVLPMPASVFRLDSNHTRTQVFALGYNQDQTNRDWQGAFGEFIFTDGLEDTATEQIIEGYLAHKWGIAASLPASHPYKSSPSGGDLAQANLADAGVTDPDGDGVTFTWSVVSKPAGSTVNFDDPSLVNAMATMDMLGTYVLRLTADDGVSTPGYDDVTIIVGEPNTYSTWASGNFTHAFVDTGYNSNSDGDNTSNLVEFAFGMDPTVSDSRSLSYVSGGNVTEYGVPKMQNFATPETPDFRAVFLRRKDHATSGLTYEVQFSADLEQWTSSATTPTRLTASNSAGDYEAVSVPCPPTVPAHGSSQNLPPQFFRVEVVID